MSKFMKVIKISLYLIMIVGVATSCIGLIGFTASFFFDLDPNLYRKIVALGLDSSIPAMVLIMWNER